MTLDSRELTSLHQRQPLMRGARGPRNGFGLSSTHAVSMTKPFPVSVLTARVEPTLLSVLHCHSGGIVSVPGNRKGDRRPRNCFSFPRHAVHPGPQRCQLLQPLRIDPNEETAVRIEQSDVAGDRAQHGGGRHQRHESAILYRVHVCMCQCAGARQNCESAAVYFPTPPALHKWPQRVQCCYMTNIGGVTRPQSPGSHGKPGDTL